MSSFGRDAAKSFFRWLGFEVSSIGKATPDYNASLRVGEAHLYSRWHGPCPLFSPWLGEPSFYVLYEDARPFTIVSADRCYILISLARYASHLCGDFAECGVYNGGTALMLARTLGPESDKTLYLFDSFAGLPAGDNQKDAWFAPGDFTANSLEAVKSLLMDFQSNVDIRVGWIPKTFCGLERNQYAFAHLDVDLYQSTLDCCSYFYSRMVPGGIMLFDEYAFASARGEKDAVDEFFADKAERPITLPTGQAFVIRTPADQRVSTAGLGACVE